MSLETTIFTSEIRILFVPSAAFYHSDKNKQMNIDLGITCLFKDVEKDDPTSAIFVEQCEEGKLIPMFEEDPEGRPLIDKADHIYD